MLACEIHAAGFYTYHNLDLPSCQVCPPCTQWLKPKSRVPKDTTPLQRGIIRHLIITIDLSSAMSEKDLRPTRYLLTIQYVTEFVREYFEQNPISQLGIIGLRDGLAIRVSNMSGNPEEHVAALRRLKDQEPKGDQSLQNGLEMARAALLYVPFSLGVQFPPRLSDLLSLLEILEFALSSLTNHLQIVMHPPMAPVKF